ncbi:hypothetical protein ACFX13_017083 [Malus domestica]|uniref:sterol carrier protein 2 isoform X2 n=1 Tax=Malus domestica TaxID=3750 RepID=UPI0010A9B051|nr:peroxisomal multifunctional enzyme type 2 isoform X1 [Malus domestica]
MASGAELKSESLLELMKEHLKTDAGKEITKKIGLVYQINIAPKKIGFNEVIFIVDLKKGEVKKGAYEGGKPDATFSFKDDDFVKVALGKMNPQIAFMRGAMKIKGSLSAATKFTPDIFPKPSKMGSIGIQVKKEGGTTHSRPPFLNLLTLASPMSGFLLLTLMEPRDSTRKAILSRCIELWK